MFAQSVAEDEEEEETRETPSVAGVCVRRASGGSWAGSFFTLPNIQFALVVVQNITCLGNFEVLGGVFGKLDGAMFFKMVCWRCYGPK